MELLDQAARQGWIPAELALGEHFFSEKEYEKAITHLIVAAGAGLAKAQVLLGKQYSEGLGVEADQSVSVDLLTKAARSGDAEGAELAGLLWERGWHVSDKNLRQLNTELAEMSKRMLAFTNQYQAHDANPKSTAPPPIDPAQLQADVKRMQDLERLKGGGVDYEIAASFYRQAADAGRPLAATRLGMLLLTGRGLAMDPSHAAEWFRKAAESNPTAAYLYGLLLDVGLGTAPDSKEAFKWQQLASDRGEIRAKIAIDRDRLGFDWTTESAALEDILQRSRTTATASEV